MSLLCRIQHRLCALPLEGLVEIMRPLPVEALSGTPSFVLGLSVIRGGAMPVVDVGALLGDEGAPVGRYVIVKVGDRFVALAVELVLGVRAISDESLNSLPPLLSHTSADIVAAVGVLDAELLLVLTCGRILPEHFFERYFAAAHSVS